MEEKKSEFGRILAELRRSNAAGKHGKHRRDRRNSKRKAIDQSLKDH